MDTEDIATGVHPHPTRPDLQIGIHDDRNGPRGDIWSTLSARNTAHREGKVWIGCTVYIDSAGNTMREAYDAAASQAHVLDAMIAAAREAMR
jgi:hypothetical protein